MFRSQPQDNYSVVSRLFTFLSTNLSLSINDQEMVEKGDECTKEKVLLRANGDFH